MASGGMKGKMSGNGISSSPRYGGRVSGSGRSSRAVSQNANGYRGRVSGSGRSSRRASK